MLPATKPIEVAEMEHDLAEYLEEGKSMACTFWNRNSCIWLANHDSILAWDSWEHGNLDVDQMRIPNMRRKTLYQQMGIPINGWGEVSAFLSIQDTRWMLRFL